MAPAPWTNAVRYVRATHMPPGPERTLALWTADIPDFDPGPSVSAIAVRDLIDRKALKAEIFDLPVGNSVEYSRGYSAAILAALRAIDESEPVG